MSAPTRVTSTLFGPRDVSPPGPHLPSDGPVRYSGFRASQLVEPVDIDAPLEAVWDVLVDFDAYPEWNPITRVVQPHTELALGERVHLSVSWGPYEEDGQPVDVRSLVPALELDETLSVLEAPYALAWSDNRGVILRAERIQHLSPLPDGRTRYATNERMEGLLVPIVARVYARRIIAGFRACGLALKSRVEALRSEREHAATEQGASALDATPGS